MNIIRKAAITATATVALFAGTFVPSFATDTPSGPPSTPNCVKYDNGTTVCTASSVSSASTDITTEDVSRGTASSNGVTSVYFIQSGGATAAQMHGKHYRLKHGMQLRTSWRVNRGYGWHMKYYPKGYTFVKGRDGYWHDPRCYNSVTGLPHGNKVLHMPEIRGPIQVYRSAADAVSLAHAKSMASGTGWASAFCELNGSKAYSQSGYTAYGFAEASSYGRGYSLLIARQAAVGGINRTKLETDAQSDAAAQTTTKVEGMAKANANCSTSSTPPKPVPPTCESVYGPGYGGSYPSCYKVGTTTPAPPAGSGGQNPPPSGGAGDPGSNKCYSESTGYAVSPNQDGTCPAGSFGS